MEAVVDVCSEPECEAASFAGGDCLAHASVEDLQFEALLLRAGKLVDARGATIDAAALRRLWAALGSEAAASDGSLREPDRRGARITGAANFNGAIFTEQAVFAGVTFDGPAYFDGAVFEAGVDFNDVSFGGHADFDGVRVDGLASFQRARFADHVGFEGARFRGPTHFEGATFRSYVDFEDASFDGSLRMRGATLQMARQLGPFAVGDELALDMCVFAERLTIEVSATRISGHSATFVDGVRLLVQRADLALDNADFARSSTLSRSARTAWGGREEAPNHLVGPPRVVTLRGAQVGALSLSGLDLRACRFFGAHELHSMTIEPSCRWACPPSRRRYSSRETIAEEHEYRGPAWQLPETRPAEWLEKRDGERCLDAGQLAALYRSLRKAREDNKDQAGAGDLYYGEMEMRRRAPRRRWGERGWTKDVADKAILTAYWLISGYGLKASRAVAALVVTALVAALALCRWGFDPPAPFLRATFFSIESVASVFRAPHTDGYRLTYFGAAVQIVLRIVGPLLIGLGLLAVRARVRR